MIPESLSAAARKVVNYHDSLNEEFERWPKDRHPEVDSVGSTFLTLQGKQQAALLLTEIADMTGSSTEGLPITEPEGQITTCVLCIPRDIFIFPNLVGLCRRIANINHPSAQYIATDEDSFLTKRFDEFFNKCGLRSFFIFEEDGCPNCFRDLQEGLYKLVKAEIAFLEHFLRRALDRPQAEKCALTETEAPIKIEASSPAEDHWVGRAALSDLHAVVQTITGEARKLEVHAKDLRAVERNLHATTEELNITAQPFREFYKDERMRKVKNDALKIGIPELVVDTIVSMYLTDKFPTTDKLNKYIGTTDFRGKLKSSGHGTSRASIGRWLTKLKTIFHRRGITHGIKLSKGKNQLLLAETNEPSQSLDSNSSHNSIGSKNSPVDSDSASVDTRAQELSEGFENDVN